MKKENNDIDPLAQERDLAGKKIIRRRDANKVVSPEALDSRNIKVQISIKLDADILEHFEARASQPGASPYQTQINQALRDILDREGEGASGEAGIRDDNESPEMFMEEISHLLAEVDGPTQDVMRYNLRLIRDRLKAKSRQNSRKLA